MQAHGKKSIANPVQVFRKTSSQNSSIYNMLMGSLEEEIPGILLANSPCPVKQNKRVKSTYPSCSLVNNIAVTKTTFVFSSSWSFVLCPPPPRPGPF